MARGNKVGYVYLQMMRGVTGTHDARFYFGAWPHAQSLACASHAVFCAVNFAASWVSQDLLKYEMLGPIQEIAVGRGTY